MGKKAIILFLFLSIFMVISVFASDQSGMEYLLERGYIADTENNLDEVVSRGEFVLVTNKVFGIYTTNGEGFIDVDANSPLYYDMMAAKLNGYLEGYDDNTVRPQEPVTRIQAAAMFDRLVELPQPMDGPVFIDDDDIQVWGKDAAKRVYTRGIMKMFGDGTFGPNKNLTRGEMYNCLAEIVKLGYNRVREDKIMTIKTFDGYEITGRLSVPMGAEKVNKLVVFVHGTGPNTYELKRQTGDIRFIYTDAYADAFAAEDTAFFSYNTRGVSISDVNPFYVIDEKNYETYTPKNVAKDIEVIVNELKKETLLEDAKVFLLGWSEGAIIAPLSALETEIELDGLILAGYPQMNMKDTLDYQLGGERGFFIYTIYFDAIGQDSISKELFESDPNGIAEALLGDIAFEDVDVDGDGLITVEDIKIHSAPLHEVFFKAIEEDDFEWMSENNIPLKKVWFQEHFDLGLTGDILLQLDIPIHIFHGTLDIMCPVEGVYEVQQQFKDSGKDNLHVNIYEGYDHDLNYVPCVSRHDKWHKFALKMTKIYTIKKQRK